MFIIKHCGPISKMFVFQKSTGPQIKNILVLSLSETMLLGVTAEQPSLHKFTKYTVDLIDIEFCTMSN